MILKIEFSSAVIILIKIEFFLAVIILKIEFLLALIWFA